MAASIDSRLVVEAERLRDEDPWPERCTFGEAILGRLEELAPDDEPVSLAGHSRIPVGQLGPIPEDVEEAAHREIAAIVLQRRRIVGDGRRCRSRCAALQRKRQLEMDVARLRIVLDRIALNLTEARQVVWCIVVVAAGVVLRP